MKKRKKRIIIISIILVVLTGTICANWNTHIYAQRLMGAINANNRNKVEKLLRNEYGNINCRPYMFDGLMTMLEAENRYPLETAFYNGNYKMVKLLVDYGADPKTYREPFWFYIFTGDQNEDRYKIAMLLVRNGADLYKKDGGESIFSFLVYGDDEKSEVKKEGYRFLVYVIEHCKEKQTIKESGVLNEASRNNNLNSVKYLIENKYFSINDKTALPLKYAAAGEAYETCKYLLKNGADPKLKDSDGITAYDYAKETKNKRIIKLIKMYQ